MRRYLPPVEGLPDLFVPLNEPLPAEHDPPLDESVINPQRPLQAAPWTVRNAPVQPEVTRNSMRLDNALAPFNRGNPPLDAPNRDEGARQRRASSIGRFPWNGRLVHPRQDIILNDNLFGYGGEPPQRRSLGVVDELFLGFGQGPPGGGLQFLEYQPSFTHPKKPQASFTFDFTPSDPIVILDSAGLDSPSSLELTKQLVCAKCSGALLINVEGPDAAKRKIWGLRCGHLLDGRCVAQIMRPVVVTEVMGDHEDDMPADKVVNGVMKLGKGKRKAKEMARFDKTRTFANTKSTVPSTDGHKDHSFPLTKDLHPSDPLSYPPILDIRSRLHSRNRLETPSSSFQPSSELSASLNMIGGQSDLRNLDHVSGPVIEVPNRYHGSGAVRGRGRKSRKGKEKAPLAPVIQDEYEWMCPVSECRLKHRSVMIDGVWKPDQRDGKGVIPIYA